jgi:hypothetical protein
MSRIPSFLGLSLPVVLWAVAGCEPSVFPAGAGPSLNAVEQIRDDSDLTVVEKRTELALLGLDDVTINAILVDERTGNQFGGDLRTAYDKVVGQRLDTLTPDEVQVYADAASEASEDFDHTVSDSEAAAVVRLLSDNDLRTSGDLNVYLADNANSVPSAIPENLLQDVFLDFDPDLLLDELP